MLEFGEKKVGVDYIERHGSYGVAIDKGKVLIEIARLGYFLPGGGLDSGETHIEALHREFMEETGYAILSAEKIGEAVEYVYIQNDGRYLKKVQHFYFIGLGVQSTPTHPDGDSHRAEWIPYEALRGKMYLESNWWAIEKAIGQNF
jgi:8-oxo-dGTP diphosphatase